MAIWRYGDNQYDTLLILSAKLERKNAVLRRVQYATLLLGHTLVGGNPSQIDAVV
jgi:hypothetical protein